MSEREELKSFATPIKRRWRKRLRRFLRHTVLKYKEPEDVNVLCLAGAEALEVFQVYDMLDIPRENIYTAEIDKRAFEELKAKDLGIKVFPIDISLIIHASFWAGMKWDVISLDFCGHFDAWDLNLIYTIFALKTLREYGVLATNFLAMREREIDKRLLHILSDFYFFSWSELWSIREKFGLPPDRKADLPILVLKPEVFEKETAEEKRILFEKLRKEIPRDCIDLWILICALGVMEGVIHFVGTHRELFEKWYKSQIDISEMRKKAKEADEFLGSQIEALLHRAMIATEMERYVYRSGYSVMKSSFFQFREAKNVWAGYTSERLFNKLSYYLCNLPKKLPKIKEIPIPVFKKPEPKVTKEEVIEAIKKGIV